MIKIAIVEDNAEEMQLMRSYVDRCSKEQNFTCTTDLDDAHACGKEDAAFQAARTRRSGSLCEP